MQISEDIQLRSVYFILGEAPKGSPPNQIKDGPAGWNLAFILGADRVLSLSTLECWKIAPDSPEIRGAKQPPYSFESDNIIRNLKKTIATRRRYSLPHDLDAANEVLSALGAAPIAPVVKQDAESKPVREDKAPKEKRPSREGLKSIKDVEEATGLKGRVIRGILREAGLKPSDAGWVGDAKWLKEILSLVKKSQSSPSSE